MLVGMVLLALSRSFDGLGVITGSIAIWLGATAGSFGQWRQEPGLWMLSVLNFGMSALVWMCFVNSRIMDIVLRGRPPLPSLSDLGFLAASLLVGFMIQF